MYDTSPFSRMANNYSIRTRVEGFLPLFDDKLQACLDNELCLCDANNSVCIQRLLHNCRFSSSEVPEPCSHILSIILLSITDLVVKELETMTKMATQSRD